MKKQKEENTVKAHDIPPELPAGKFEIWLPFNPVNDEFAVECEAALHLGAVVICQDVACRVYFFRKDSAKKQYHIGLVRAE